jgi:hypothetical protein
MNAPRRTISIQPIIAAAILLIFFGGIGIAKLLGWWQVAGGRTAPTVISRTESGDIYDPADIRGSSTFGEIEQYFAVPAEVIAEAFGIEAVDAGAITAKFVDELYGEMEGLSGEVIDVGTDAVKLFVAHMTGIPYEADAVTGLPESAIDVILSLGPGMTEAERQALFARAGESRTVVFDGGTDAAVSQSAEFDFKGSTTFAEVMARGVTAAQIEEVLGMSMGAPTEAIRTFCDENELSFSTVRTALGTLLEGEK